MLKILTLLLASSAAAFSAVISDMNVTLSKGGGGISEYTLTVYQDAGRTDYTSIFFGLQGQNLIFRSYNLDESSDWYFAALNDSFSASSITQGTFPAFNQIGESYSFGPGAFYLGVNTGIGLSGGVPNRDVFGWARLRNTADGLELLGSGMTYNSAGIVVGTAQEIPEPAPSVLAVLPSLAIVIARRRTRTVVR